MKYYLGVTDNDWYSFLSKRDDEDINFWQPSGKFKFRVLEPGAPFLFKLKKPFNAIGGIAFFSSHAILPLDVAWDTFKQSNGIRSYYQFKELIKAYRNPSTNPFDKNPNIGCIVLSSPVFFEQEDWIPTPSNWGNSIVQGKSYSTDEEIGKEVWQQVELLLEKYKFGDLGNNDTKSELIAEEPQIQYGTKKYLTKVRIGQAAFRVRLTEAYHRKCAFSGEKTLPALEAAHIKPYSESGPHKVSNGLLLRADFHKLFDAGYVTLTTDYKIEVSSKIKEEFNNGKDYYKYHGSNLFLLPEHVSQQPNPAYIEWHNSEIYKG